jgi:hypothetical protein
VGFVIPPVFVLDEQVQLGERGLSCDASAEAAIERAATALLSVSFTPDPPERVDRATLTS